MPVYMSSLALKCNTAPGLWVLSTTGSELVVSLRKNDRYLQMENKQAEPMLIDVPTVLSVHWHRFWFGTVGSVCVSYVLIAASSCWIFLMPSWSSQSPCSYFQACSCSHLRLDLVTMAAKQIPASNVAFQSQNLHFLPTLKDIMVSEWRQQCIKVSRMHCVFVCVCGWKS